MPFVKPEEVAKVAVGLGLIALVVNNPAAFTEFAAIALIAVMAIWFIRRSLHRAKQARVFEAVSASIERHENALISYYHQLRREDLFGTQDESRWLEKIDTFLRNQVIPDVPDFTTWRRSATGQRAAAMVYEATAQKVEILKKENPLARIDASNLTPLEYERHCAELLKDKGWTVKMTPATRDGGADFIAEKHGQRMVVQCKRYARPVGNKAVQEVTSARSLYNGNVACVVAPTGFTRQAQQEAYAQQVELLHHSALPAFAERLAVSSSFQIAAITIPPAIAGEETP